MVSYLKRMLGFGTDTNALESKGFLVLAGSALYAVYVWYTGRTLEVDPTELAEHVQKILIQGAAWAGVLRSISAFVKPFLRKRWAG